VKYVPRAVTSALCAAVALIPLSCRPARQSAPEAPKSVAATAARRAPLALTLDYPARIKPREEIVISSKIAGRVAAVKAAVGQSVRRGDILFTLESGDYDAQYRQARAALASARANLTRTSDSSQGQQVIQAQAAVNQAQVQYDDARDLYERSRKLFDSGSIPRQQLDSVEGKYKSAGIALATSKDSLRLIQDKSGPQSSSVVSAQVEQAQAQADLAKSQLENAVIKSPIAGVISARNVDAGELVSPGMPAFVVIDDSALVAETSVSDRMVDKVVEGERVTVTVSAAGDLKLQGTVDIVNPAVDPRTQSYTVKVSLPETNGLVRPGMFAAVSFTVEKRENALVVPNGAVLTENGADFVYVAADGVLVKKSVSSGISDDAVTEITSGLAEGDMVVTEGQSFLTAGEKVTVAP
jgi:multidrug efflux pump subunit AcrA (membrane-fusion protein)